MKNHQMSLEARGGLLIAAALTFISLSSIPIQAQVRAPNAETRDPGRLGMSDRDRNLLERETQLRMLERQPKRAVKSDPVLAFAQIREDFRRIQVVDHEVMRAVSSGNALDYKYISEAAAEIRKRASRLKTNLVFPEGENDNDEARRKKGYADVSGLTPSLTALDQLILSFVHNPVFKDAGVVDTKLGGKARRDLDIIIEVSDKVRKIAERMRKNTGK